MILVADSGSTKTSWCLIAKNEGNIHFSTEGFNPYYVDSEYISNSLLANVPADIDKSKVLEIYYYGAGCNAAKASVVEEALKNVFPNVQTIFVASDLLAAARSVLGNEKGFVAILGTGTNSCIYADGEIAHQVDSLGFILGDEGSGAYIGKQLLVAYNRGFLPKELSDLFFERFNISPEEVINNIYTKILPNRFSAGFSKFVGENILHPFMDNMVRNCFRDFFRNIVSYYPNFTDYTFNCVGSIAYYYHTQLKDVAAEFNMDMGNITKNPLEGLLKYHDYQMA